MAIGMQYDMYHSFCLDILQMNSLWGIVTHFNMLCHFYPPSVYVFLSIVEGQTPLHNEKA